MKLRKMTPEYKANVIKALDIVSKISDLSSDYYWLFQDEFRIEDRHPDRYDEVNEDITALFVEDITYKELYHSWDLGKLPFFDNHPKYGGFIIDEISGIIHAKQETHTPEERFDMLSELFNLALYLIENPLKSNEGISDETILKSKDYSTRSEKADRIKTILMMEGVKANVIDEVVAMVRV